MRTFDVKMVYGRTCSWLRVEVGDSEGRDDAIDEALDKVGLDYADIKKIEVQEVINMENPRGRTGS